MDGGSIWTVCVVALALALALVGLNAATADAAEDEFVTRNLTVDQGTDVNVTIDAYRVSDDETVTSNNTTLTEGTDYQWYPTNTTLRWYTTSNLTDGDDATLNVSAERLESEEQQTTSILATFGGWVGLLLMVVALGWIVNTGLGGF